MDFNWFSRGMTTGYFRFNTEGVKVYTDFDSPVYTDLNVVNVKRCRKYF